MRDAKWQEPDKSDELETQEDNGAHKDNIF